jgi:hypothetical protein
VELDEAYEHCRRTTAGFAQTFYFASMFQPQVSLLAALNTLPFLFDVGVCHSQYPGRLERAVH